MDQAAEDLKVRTKRFATDVFALANTLQHSIGGDAVARQLVRAALGVAGNYHAACRARTHTEFTARLGIVLEEADEAELWLEIVDTRKLTPSPHRSTLLNESRQLRAIFAKACQTARQRERAPKQR